MTTLAWSPETILSDWTRRSSSLATLRLWAPDHQGSLDKHLDFSDDCEEPLPSTSGQTSQRRGGVPAPMEIVTLLVPHQQGLTTPGPHFCEYILT